MSNVASIGERLYRKVVTPVYSEDRQFYDCGCIVHGKGGAISVIFVRYKSTGGIVGRCKPSDEMAGWLKQYGHELKEYIGGQDERERQRLGRGKHEIKNFDHTFRRSLENFALSPPPGVGSEKRKSANAGNGKGERTQLTNEK